MKIEILYKDLYDRTASVFIDELANKYQYHILNFSDLLRFNLGNKTELGNQIRAFIEKGEFASDSLIFEVVKEEISNIKSAKLLIINFPRNNVQLELLGEYCITKNHELIRAWHLVALNVLQNLVKHPRYSKMAEKHESHENIKYRSEKNNSENNDSIKRISKFCNTIIFKSQSYGINYQEDKQRIKETIYNTL